VSKPAVFVQLTHKQRDLDRARKLLRRVEKEIKADWRYADFQRDAYDEIVKLATALRAVLGPDPVQESEQR
jgi:predicted ATP-dependent protease